MGRHQVKNASTAEIFKEEVVTIFCKEIFKFNLQVRTNFKSQQKISTARPVKTHGFNDDSRIDQSKRACERRYFDSLIKQLNEGEQLT